MDIPPRPRGRGRRQPLQSGEQVAPRSPFRPQAPQNFQNYPRPSGRPRYTGQPRPLNPLQQGPSPLRQPRPLNPAQHGPSPSGQPRPLNPVQQGPRTYSPPGVEQIQRGIQKMVTGDAPVPMGRGNVREGRTFEYYRLPRPEHTLVAGKKGSSGSPVTLIANYFPITSYTTFSLYQYSLDFDPPEERTPIKKGMLKQHSKRFGGGYISDGSTLYTSARLDPDNFELTSTRLKDDQKFIIKVKFVNVIQPGDHVYIQVFNILLRNCFRHLELTLIGRNFYDEKAKTDYSQYKLQLWPGYEATLARYEANIMLCADISTKVVRTESVFDFFMECYSNKEKDSKWMINFKKIILGQSVMTSYNNKMYRIDDIDETSTPSSTFSRKDGSMISYIEYYQEKYKIIIKNIRQPMLISKKKKSVLNNDSEETLIYLVPELCLLTGISETLRNNFSLMRGFSEITRVDPSERYKRLMKFNQRLQSNEKIVNEFKNWDLTLGKDLVTVPARILPPEKINSNCKEYDGGKFADWTKHLWNTPMFTCALIKNWVVVAPRTVYSGDIQAPLHNFLCSLSKVASQMSFNLPPPYKIFLQDTRPITYMQGLERAINEHNPSLILCITTSNKADIYSAIKRKLCIDRAVPSQVVLLKNVSKTNLSVCTKIAIQLNCKLGGSPWMVKIPSKKMMIIGFDVCHDSQTKKSYGALVATLDDNYTTYFSCAQPHGEIKEISDYFANAVCQALFKYKSKNKVFPSNVFIYRDGVGEGQISHVHQTEISLLKKQLNDCGAEICFTFILVTKRISARFFLGNKNTNLVNPDPGTIIDSVVTDPTKYDFYLVSQKVTRGTVTPTHYQILEDTNKFPPDIVQKLTFKLCHSYFNWSGTVRVPGVCQLAHKLAFLACKILKGTPNNSLDELLYYL